MSERVAGVGADCARAARRVARSPAALLAIAVACLAAVAALWLAANGLAAGRRLDARAGDLLHALAPDAWAPLLKGASSLADTLPYAVGALALAALAALRGGAPLALTCTLTLLAGNAFVQLAAQPALTPLRRTDLTGTAIEGSGSWPSGHAAAAMLLALCATVAAGPRLRPLAAAGGLGYALAVGGALVAIGGHLPSDVLAGFLVAAAFAAAGAAAHLRARRGAPRRASPRSPALGPALGALAALALLATAAGKALATRPTQVAEALDRAPVAIAVAAVPVGAAAVAAAAALARRRARKRRTRAALFGCARVRPQHRRDRRGRRPPPLR